MMLVMCVPRLWLDLVKIVAKDSVHEIGLRNLGLIGCSFGEFLVFVRDDELSVVIRERPRAHIAIQRTSTAGVTFHVVALFTEWLPIPQIIRASSITRDFMIRAKFHVRFLRP